jgi:hypothetical protein
MGVYPSTTIISEDVFRRDECPKNFEEFVKQGYMGGDGILIQGKRFFVISWCQHYDQNMWEELEETCDEKGYIVKKELAEYKDEYFDEDDEDDSNFKYRVDNWLDKLQSLHQELVF